MLTHQVDFFERLHFGPYGGCPLKFLHALQPLNCISSWTLGAGRPQVVLCPIFLVHFLFILPRGLRVPSADRRETLPFDRNLVDPKVPKFGGTTFGSPSSTI